MKKLSLMKKVDERKLRKKQYYVEHRNEYIARLHERILRDQNSNGITKHNIRKRSRLLLRSNGRLPGYEIHHCFGYDDYRKFIYIPRHLHLEIHKLLRDRGISADYDHWNVIRDLVNSCEEYTYIRS